MNIIDRLLNHSHHKSQRRDRSSFKRYKRTRRDRRTHSLPRKILSPSLIPYITLFTLSSLLSLLVTTVTAQPAPSLQSSPAAVSATARTLYTSGQFNEAIAVLQQALQAYQETGDLLQQAMTLSNLSLVYQQLGAWTEATQAIEQGLALLQTPTLADSSDRLLVSAQTLDVQGKLLLLQGQTELALDRWEQATTLYEQAEEPFKAIQTQINQAQALQDLGLYRRAITLLTDISQTLQTRPASLAQAIALRSLGDALLTTGDLPQAEQVMTQSLQLSETLADAEAIATAHLSFGNLIRAQALANLNLSNLTPDQAIPYLNLPPDQSLSPTELILQRRYVQAATAYYQQTEQALNHYQQAIDRATLPQTQLQASLNQLNLLIETQRWQAARSLYPQIQAQLDPLPTSRSRIYDQIHLAQNLVKLSKSETSESQAPALSTITQLLTTSIQQAETLGDRRAQSYALGSLGQLYEQTQQWQSATDLTQQALLLAQQLNAGDIAYQWQWQLGRLAQAEGDRNSAIVAYQDAVNTLKTLRSDLVAINRDVQFSFRESVEPVYRELVNLLLQTNDQNLDVSALTQARDVIEGLQIAELDNFFREACLDTAFQIDRVIDQANLPSAIVYTIILPDRLEIILKLPQQELMRFTQFVPQTQVEATIETLIGELKRPYTSQVLQTLSQQIYDWLIRPAEAELAKQEISTLVFVLDGALRSLPMAALYDGQQYLIEKYSVALAPGLQLPDPKPLQQGEFRALVAGLSEARQDFPPLNFVEAEVNQIQADVPSEVLLNQQFTEENFQTLLRSTPFSIVHVATHGQFSSNAAETFILAWDRPINVNQLSQLLQTQTIASPEPIELLVLSACRTAAGDKRATLGLAGVAVRAGARSTIASLWNLDDDSGAVLMQAFYRTLTENQISKAEALRDAQRSLLSNPQYAAPRFWAPYVLLGNWL
jgi:CHAT domain-containing protein